MTQPAIAAVTANHNTSRYAELMLRSLHATHDVGPEWSITVVDNDSTDGVDDLRGYAESWGIAWRRSGLGTDTANNSHGEILRQFVLDQPECDYYLFLDSDVCFLQRDTIPTMRRELDADPSAFGIMPRLSWDGLVEIPEEVRRGNPDIQEARLHPCCALVRNTSPFRAVARDIGLSAVKVLWADREEYLDTFKLMTCVMATHGLRHIVSSTMVVHFFTVSYDWDTPKVRQWKESERDRRLEALRRGCGGCRIAPW